MIEVKKLGKVEKGIACFVCCSKEDVLALNLKGDDRPGTNVTFLCADCRADLTVELFKSLGG